MALFSFVLWLIICFLWQESADSSKPITAADVHQFFDDIKNKRRRVQWVFDVLAVQGRC